MPIIGNPWAHEAAQFGASLGGSLGNAMINMPQQREMLALQAAAQRQSQQAEMLHLALQQQANQQNYQLGQSEMAMRQTELAKQLQQMIHANELSQAKIDALRKGKYRTGKDAAGRTFLYNDTTKDYQYVNPPDTSGQSTGPSVNFSVPMTQNQAFENFTKLNTLAGNQRQMGYDKTNSPNWGEFNTTTNFMAQLSRALNPPQQQQFGSGMTNLPPQALGATNRIGRFLVEPAQ